MANKKPNGLNHHYYSGQTFDLTQKVMNEMIEDIHALKAEVERLRKFDEIYDTQVSRILELESENSLLSAAARDYERVLRGLGENKKCYVCESNKGRAMDVLDKLSAETPPVATATQTCGSCNHFKRCEGLLSRKGDETECDWSPSRYAPKCPPSAEKEKVEPKCSTKEHRYMFECQRRLWCRECGADISDAMKRQRSD